MSTDLEAALTRTMAAAAATAPAPDRGFANAVHTRQKQIRTGRTSLTVAASVAAVVSVLIGMSLYVRPHPESETPSASDVPIATDPPLDHLPPAAETWPNAVRRLPGELPGGDVYTVAALLDDGRYIIYTAERVLEWTPSNGDIRELGHLVQPSGKSDYHIFRVAVGDGQVAWVTTFSGSTVALEPVGSEVWTAPLAGGDRRRVLDASAKLDVEALMVVGNDVIVDHGGLSRIPVAGGARTPIPDSVDLNLSPTLPWAVGSMAPDLDVPILNLATGERRSIPRFNGGTGYAYCSPEFCIATDTTSYSIGRAGNGATSQRVSFATWCNFTSNPDVATCTTPITGLDVTYIVWNVRSGRIAEVPEPSVGDGKSTAYFPSWIDANGDLVLLDPSAISS
jgi:hypothetical protein